MCCLLNDRQSMILLLCCYFISLQGTVPLDCECRVAFGDASANKWCKYLTFSCSFLLPHRFVKDMLE
jgi:hypothetical protein